MVYYLRKGGHFSSPSKGGHFSKRALFHASERDEYKEWLVLKHALARYEVINWENTFRNDLKESIYYDFALKIIMHLYTLASHYQLSYFSSGIEHRTKEVESSLKTSTGTCPLNFGVINIGSNMKNRRNLKEGNE